MKSRAGRDNPISNYNSQGRSWKRAEIQVGNDGVMEKAEIERLTAPPPLIRRGRSQ